VFGAVFGDVVFIVTFLVSVEFELLAKSIAVALK